MFETSLWCQILFCKRRGRQRLGARGMAGGSLTWASAHGSDKSEEVSREVAGHEAERLFQRTVEKVLTPCS